MEDLDLKHKFLTKKNIILIVVILILIVVAIILFFILNKQNLSKADETLTFSTSDFTISLPAKYKFSKLDTETYSLALRAGITDSSIYFSKVLASTIRDKQKFVEYDKDDYISKFSNISEVSEVKTKSINGLEVYNYNFKYKETMYVDVYWILKDSTFYIVDFNINTVSNDLTPYVEEILNSLKFN